MKTIVLSDEDHDDLVMFLEFQNASEIMGPDDRDKLTRLIRKIKGALEWAVQDSSIPKFYT